MAEQLIYLAPGEGLPGFPSGHGPGAYLVDYELRTIRPASVEIPQPTEETTTDSQPEVNEGG